VHDVQVPAPQSLVAVRNSPGSPLARLTAWLEEDGLHVREVSGESLGDPAVGALLERADGIVLLGGGFMPDDDAVAPWLPRDRELAARALARGTPLLGICLGAQLLALVAGGRVLRSHGVPERGSCLVSLTSQAAGDPLFGTLPDDFPTIQNHSDQVVELPPGGVLLATSPVCRVQAFRVGAAAWGVQFHPEAAASRLVSWDESALAQEGLDLAAMRREAERVEPRATEVARLLARQFAQQVRGHR
jgi:GMP synthase-like glutamine amidotransferase